MIPNFGKFVLDYMSGVDDYELIKEYRPYHLYLEFLINLTKLDVKYSYLKFNFYEYLLRENLGPTWSSNINYPIQNISLSDLMFDNYVYKQVSNDINNIIFDKIFEIIFEKMGILIDHKMVIFENEEQTYSFNTNDISDITIIIDNTGVFCINSEKSETFTDFFKIYSQDIVELLEYAKQFVVNS